MTQEKLFPESKVTEEGLHIPPEENELAYLYYKMITKDLAPSQMMQLLKLKAVKTNKEKKEALKLINAPEEFFLQEVD